MSRGARGVAVWASSEQDFDSAIRFAIQPVEGGQPSYSTALHTYFLHALGGLVDRSRRNQVFFCVSDQLGTK